MSIHVLNFTINLPSQSPVILRHLSLASWQVPCEISSPPEYSFNNLEHLQPSIVQNFFSLVHIVDIPLLRSLHLQKPSFEVGSQVRSPLIYFKNWLLPVITYCSHASFPPQMHFPSRHFSPGTTHLIALQESRQKYINYVNIDHLKMRANIFLARL